MIKMPLKSIVGELKETKDGIGGTSRRGIEAKHWSSRRISFIAPDVGPFEPMQEGQWANLPPELLLDIIRRVEESETSWPAMAIVIFCASVCRSWRDITKEIVKTPEECGRLTFPGPRDAPIQCFIKRDRATCTYQLYFGLTHLRMRMIDYCSKKIRRATSTDFVSTLVADDFSRASNTYIGKLKGPRRMNCVIHSVPVTATQEGGIAPTPA